jgi:hypothetical protein
VALAKLVRPHDTSFLTFLLTIPQKGDSLLFMPNPRYIAGRAYEYKAKRKLEEAGYHVIRAAGSHGKYDLMAVHEGFPVRCIQVKRVQKEGAMKRLFFDWDQLPHNDDKNYREELWVWFRGRFHCSHDDFA